MENTPSLHLVFSPRTNLISIVRRFVLEFYAQLIPDADAAGRLALATQELLENAAKYTTCGETSLDIELDRAAGAVTIRTRNRTDATCIALLRRSFAESAAIPDPAVFYDMVLRRSARQIEGSGLGLARIRAEGEMALTLIIDTDMVEIHGRTSVTGAESR
jgi:hypothetical protein